MWAILGPLAGIVAGVVGYSILKPAPKDQTVKVTKDEISRAAVNTLLTNAKIEYTEQLQPQGVTIFLVKSNDVEKAVETLGYHS